MIQILLGSTPKKSYNENVKKLIEKKIASRLAKKDPNIWGDQFAADASQRLGWVNLADMSYKTIVKLIEDNRKKFHEAGITSFILCGMGGSSLGAEVIASKYGINLSILDSTDPCQVKDSIPTNLKNTAVIIASKSGTTLETECHKRIFEKIFKDANLSVSKHMIVITDPGTELAETSREAKYTTIEANSKVGGRYSALSAFGLVPPGLSGLDVKPLLKDAIKVEKILSEDSVNNPALKLASAIAGAKPLHNTIIFIDTGNKYIRSLIDWIEQLLAESTGKSHTGILPVIVQPGDFEEIHKMPHSIIIRLNSDFLNKIQDNEIRVNIANLGGHLVFWEYVTAFISYLLQVNPFDQPNVEQSKQETRNILNKNTNIANNDLSSYSLIIENGIEVLINSQYKEIFNKCDILTLKTIILTFVKNKYAGFLAIHAYLNKNQYNEFSYKIRASLAKESKLPTTFGWGPRFLHSTGQYHKGGEPNGIFLQIKTEYKNDLPVPGYKFTLGQIINAQASGDSNVLNNLNYPVLTLNIKNNTDEAIAYIQKVLGLN